MRGEIVRAAAGLVAGLVAVIAAVVAAPVVAPAAPGPGAPVAAAVPVQSAACAVPGDCRLDEAGAASGVLIGLASSNGSAQHRSTLLAEADVVVNHELSWAGIEPDRGVWDFTKADENYQFAVDHGLHQIAMHFAWDQLYLDDLPDWVLAITDPDELRAVLRTRAQTIFARYPLLDRIDVINEPLQTLGSDLYPNHFFQVLGPDYVEELFTIVESEAPPTVALFVNEGGVEYQPAKADALVALVADLRAEGHRVDGVGLQTHLSVGEPDWSVLDDTMRRLDALGAAPFISELDAPVPATVPDRAAVQAERYRRVVEICLRVPGCDLIDVWGVSDADTWYDWALYPDLDPVLFDDAFQPKAAYVAVRDQLLGGRLDPAVPPSFLVPATEVLAGGTASTGYAFECRATGPIEPRGYDEIARIMTLFVGGNPVRVPVGAELRWTPTVAEGAPVRYELDLSVDLAEVARLYREETARPAVGLGGYLPLVDTVSLEMSATRPTLSFPVPAGAAVTGGPVVTAGPTGSAATVTGGAVAITLPPLSGDSRAPTPPVGLSVAFELSGPGPAVLDLGPPTFAFELVSRLGVVYSGIQVYGGAAGTFGCLAAGVSPVPRAVVGAAPSPPSGSAPGSPPSAPPGASVAEPVTGTPGLVG